MSGLFAAGAAAYSALNQAGNNAEFNKASHIYRDKREEPRTFAVQYLPNGDKHITLTVKATSTENQEGAQKPFDYANFIKHWYSLTGRMEKLHIVLKKNAIMNLFRHHIEALEMSSQEKIKKIGII